LKNIEKLDNLCWYRLSKNENAIFLLEKHPDKIHWESLSLNNNIIMLINKLNKRNNLDIIPRTSLADTYKQIRENISNEFYERTNKEFNEKFHEKINNNDLEKIKTLNETDFTYSEYQSEEKKDTNDSILYDTHGVQCYNKI